MHLHREATSQHLVRGLLKVAARGAWSSVALVVLPQRHSLTINKPSPTCSGPHGTSLVSCKNGQSITTTMLCLPHLPPEDGYLASDVFATRVKPDTMIVMDARRCPSCLLHVVEKWEFGPGIYPCLGEARKLRTSIPNDKKT
jgi:hypothetical protein